MLGWRLALGPLLIAALVGIIVGDAYLGSRHPLLLVLFMALGARSVWELTMLLRVRALHPSFPWTIALTLLIIVVNWLPEFWHSPRIGGWLQTIHDVISLPPGPSRLGLTMVILSLAFTIILLRGVIQYRAAGSSLEHLGAELFVIMYVGVLASMAAQLLWVHRYIPGYVPLSSLVIVTKCGDTMAYFVGRAFGKRKLIPRLSPGKTWAGAVGAVLGAAAGSWCWFQWVLPRVMQGPINFSVIWTIAFGVIIGLIGLIGDLSESLIKRDVGQKDSAPLLPGFGGLLDLLDSILYAAPAAYLLWLLLPRSA